jgi:hypothetical protein
MAGEYQENFDTRPIANFVLSCYLDQKLIPWQNINGITIREYIYDIIPRVELQFQDNGMFVEMNPILEGQELKIVVKLNAEQNDIINQKFEVIGSRHQPTNPERTDQYTVTVTAAFKPSIFMGPLENRFYPRKKFSEVISEIGSLISVSTDIRLDTKDKMTWYQPNQNYMDFINDSLNRCNPGEDDTPFCYSGRDGKLVLTSLRTELDQDSGIVIMNDPQNSLNATIDKNNKYFYTHAYGDNSGFFNKRIAYGIKYSYNDGTNIQVKEIADYKSTKLSGYKNKNKNLNKGAVEYRNFGFLNNVYDQYFDSIVRNEFIRTSFLSSPLTVNAQPGSYELFQKIDIQIRSQNIPNTIVQSYSGTYLIGGIIHHMSKKATYDMVLVLFRDGIDDSKTYDKFKNTLEKS